MNVSVSPPGRRRTARRTGCAVEATLSVIGGVWKPVLLSMRAWGLTFQADEHAVTQSH